MSSEELVFPERPSFQKARFLPDLTNAADFYIILVDQAFSASIEI
jgi:hypothetical protein